MIAMKRIEPFTFLGRVIAGPMKFILYRWVDHKLSHCVLDVRGTDCLRDVAREAFILAANHVGVPAHGIALSGPSPDTFILERILRQTTGQVLRTTPVNEIVPIPGLDWLGHPIMRTIVAQTRKGLVSGMGHIPFQHGDPASVRGIVHAMENAILPGHQVLLLYPVGRWAPDLAPEQEFQEGIGFLSIHFQLSIVPAYIRGYSSWEFAPDSPPVTVAFGQPLRPALKNRRTMTKDVAALTACVKTEMLRLRERVLTGPPPTRDLSQPPERLRTPGPRLA
jgi:1-acyl-sn-glycerol-3-phosphate acyltransferase